MSIFALHLVCVLLIIFPTGSDTLTSTTITASPELESTPDYPSSTIQDFSMRSSSTASLLMSTLSSTKSETETFSPVKTTKSATPVQCGVGFVACKDGRCEPYESLCGSTGAYTTTAATTDAMTVEQSTTSGPVITSITMVTSTVSRATDITDDSSSTTPLYGTSAITASVTHQPSTSPGGPEVCLPGWEDCQDGTCEPFHWLCVEHLTPATVGSTSAGMTVTQGSMSSPVTYDTFETRSVSTMSHENGLATSATPLYKTSVLTASVTPQLSASPGGPEACLPGWEDCKDGTCEPFHWLCVEHLTPAIVGR